MPRRDTTFNQREFLENAVTWEIVQGQYANVATNQHIPWCDATPRYMAIPPVPNTIGLAIDTANMNRRPDQVEFYRPGSGVYHLRLDTAPETRYAAAMQPALYHRYTLNPGVNTIGWVAAANTDNLRINFLYGA